MEAMAAKAWALSLLVLALSGCSALQCHHEGRFWDGCNWCYCRDRVVVGCTNMACVGAPEDTYRIDPNRATIGPPKRDGMFAYRPGHGRVVDPTGWPCQLGSSWLEEGGCVRCICANKMIKCRDSGMCLNGEPVSNELMPPQTQYVRRRRENAAADTAAVAAAPTAAAPTAAATESTTSTAWAATEPAATTAAAGGAAEVAETTLAPVGADSTAATPAPEAANATQSTVAPLATTTAQNTVVKDRSCRGGSTWEEDCNSCWCLDNGRAACTQISCEPPPLPLGAPGTTASTTAATTAATAPGPGAAAAAAAPAPAGVAPAGVAPTTVASSTPAPQAAAVEPAAPASSTRRKRRVVLVGA